jgi:hypothetical protein
VTRQQEQRVGIRLRELRLPQQRRRLRNIFRLKIIRNILSNILLRGRGRVL